MPGAGPARTGERGGGPISTRTSEPSDVPADPAAPLGAGAEAEQPPLDAMYARLDELRDRTRRRLQDTKLSRAGGSAQARSERDAFAARDTDRLARLEAVEEGLCFGRLDFVDAGTAHIGRIGLSDEQQNTLLVDWRAPLAEPFYRATAVQPEGVLRRRHIRTRGRRVAGVEDDLLTLDGLEGNGGAAGGSGIDVAGLSGEGALMAALAAQRTGHMRDVVATLQAEQDRVVRAPLDQPLVVQGGPGTGKTVVALHRAAYLLYTYRERLGRSGVLVVGPGQLFLRYVSEVLPALGETSVVLTSMATLFPGVEATGTESDDVALVKGDRRMPTVLTAAVAARQRDPGRAVDVVVDAVAMRFERRSIELAFAAARSSNRPHNKARSVFLRKLLGDLARTVNGREWWNDASRSERDLALRDLIREPGIRQAVNAMWPHLTPQDALIDFYADADGLDRVARALPREWRQRLAREPDQPFTPADVPLLDELAELLDGSDDAEDTGRARSRRHREQEYAQHVLGNSEAGGFVDAQALAERYEGGPETFDLAERAAADRTWAYGHVIVDEAQDLSWMAWRALARRCPSRSMTIVGDLAQVGAAGGTDDWQRLLGEHLAGRGTIVELTVGYRTPAEVMTVAEPVLAAIDPRLRAPRAVRRSGIPPVVTAVARPALVPSVVEAVQRVRSAGTVAVIAPPGLHDALRPLLAETLGTAFGRPDDASVALLTARESKGLEFDAVVVADPAAILDAGPRGTNDLYVAITRTTGHLVVLCVDRVPPPLPAGG
jgi:DNA helicase IV